jgi:acyl-coenzyme A thioesterase PaaI-like protein
MQVAADGSIPEHSPNCFGCGTANPAGIGLHMRVEGETVVADLRFDRRHEGAPGLVHGGAVAAALDDLFGGVLVVLAAPAVTANLNVDYRAPVPLERALRLTARCTGVRGRKLDMEARMELEEGHVLAEATALFLRVDLAHFEGADAPIPDAWRSWDALTPPDKPAQQDAA